MATKRGSPALYPASSSNRGRNRKRANGDAHPPFSLTEIHERVRQAIPGSRGLISEIARRAELPRARVIDALKAFRDLQEAWSDEREQVLDLAEQKLFQAVEEGHKWAITLMLTTAGRTRGYAPAGAPETLVYELRMPGVPGLPEAENASDSGETATDARGAEESL